MRMLVVDAADRAHSSTIEVSGESTLADTRALAISLPLPSCERVLEGDKYDLCLCHDGSVLAAADEDAVTLAQLGILEAPVLVVLARLTQPTAQADVAATRPAPADSPAPAPTPAPPRARAAPPEDATCRICFGAAYEGGMGKLFSPCLCSGSNAYVHVTCLNEWRAASANSRSFYQCDQCHYQYNVERTEWAAWLESERVVMATAALLLVGSTLVASLLLGPLGVARQFYRLVAFQPAVASHSGVWVASYWAWPLDYLVSGLLGVAAGGLGVSMHEAYLAHRHMQQSWIFGLATALCTSDERIFRVFALFGYVHAMKVALRVVEQIAKQQLTKWGTTIMEVQR